MSNKVIICNRCGAPREVGDMTRPIDVTEPCMVCHGTDFYEPSENDVRHNNLSEANIAFLENIVKIFGGELVVSCIPDYAVMEHVRTDIASDKTISRELRLQTIDALLKGL